MAVFEVSEPTLAVLALSMVALIGLSAQVRDRSRQLVVDYGVIVIFAASMITGIWLFLNRNSEFVDVLLTRYWLLALFAIFILEGAMMLYFAPSESLVPAAIALTVTTDIAQATPQVYALIIGTAVLGATIGQYLLFLLAKRWGRDWLLDRPWFRISDERLQRFEGWFEKWGILAVPVSNTLLFTRGMLTIPAGLADMDDLTFIVLSALGTLSFQIILALVALGVIELGIF